MPALPIRSRRTAPIAFLFFGAALVLLGEFLAPAPLAGQAWRQSETGPRLPAHLSPDTAVVSTDRVTIGGEEVAYRATVGFRPVVDAAGEPTAALLYTFYERTDVDDPSDRPLVFSFNGGPGSGSLWMHLGYTGPKKLKIDPEGYPVLPYGVEDNPHSILDVADIVFVNPVNVGFSRVVGDADPTAFFGVNEDIGYLADWIDRFVSDHDRWLSPKFLIGESYGTTRVSGLAGQLAQAHWMFLEGVILVSPTGLGVDREGPVGQALTLPGYAAVAWHHGQLSEAYQTMELESFLVQVEEYAMGEYLSALAYGGHLPAERRRAVADRVAAYTGLDRDYILDYNLAVPVSAFRKELLREEEGLTVGRLDGRYRGLDRMNAGESYDYDPALSAWNQAFAPAINHYLRNELGFDPGLRYWLFGPVRPWNREGDETGEMLRSAMASNPFLRVLIQSGYYDTGTDYFSAKWTSWNLDPRGSLQDRIDFEGYRSGHMMYLRAEDLEVSNRHIREFIDRTLAAARGPARY